MPTKSELADRAALILNGLLSSTLGYKAAATSPAVLVRFALNLARELDRQIAAGKRGENIKRGDMGLMPKQEELFPNGVSVEEEVSEEETPAQETPRKKRARFIAPTLQEVVQYIEEYARGYFRGTMRIDTTDVAHAYMDHYTACGWRIGNKPMKDWKAAARLWIRRMPEFGGGRNSQNEPVRRPLA